MVDECHRKEFEISFCFHLISQFVENFCIFYQENAKRLAPVSEAEIRAAFTARLGMPLTGQLLPSTLPYYPILPGMKFS